MGCSYGKTDWKGGLKVLMKKAGGEGKPTLFLFTDTEIKDESFVEDINMILNTGEVPNLFAPDEKTEILEVMQTAVRVLVSIERVIFLSYVEFGTCAMSLEYLCGLFNTLSAGILSELTRKKLCFIFQCSHVPVHCSFFHTESKNGISQSIIQLASFKQIIFMICI